MFVYYIVVVLMNIENNYLKYQGGWIVNNFIIRYIKIF